MGMERRTLWTEPGWLSMWMCPLTPVNANFAALKGALVVCGF